MAGSGTAFFGLTGLDKARFFQAALGDTAAFALFQMPCYVVVLLLAGATWSQIGSSVVSFTILVAFSGRIYGVFPGLLPGPGA